MQEGAAIKALPNVKIPPMCANWAQIVAGPTTCENFSDQLAGIVDAFIDGDDLIGFGEDEDFVHHIGGVGDDE